MLLAGDIGGTHSRLTLLARSPRGLRAVRHEVFESRAFGSLEDVLRVFLGKPASRVSSAAFGVAGPVVNGRSEVTNLPWIIDARVLSRRLRIPRVVLMNDLVAQSMGALGVARAKLHVLGGAGAPKRKGGNIAVLAAGTGLGEAVLVWDTKEARFLPSPTEGGHSDFAPHDALEDELLVFLRARFGHHVSWERVLSGNGVGNLYDFFREAKGVPETPETSRIIAGAIDRNSAIAQFGINGTSHAASRAMTLFSSIYGAEAGNLALNSLAIAGVYVCGKIAASAVSLFDRGDFHRAFVDKGRQAPLMEKIPVAVVLDPDVGLVGAARVASLG